MVPSRKGKSWILLLALLIAIWALIEVPSPIGLADNSDFNRVMRAFGIESINGIKYYSAAFQYHLSDPATVPQYFYQIFQPVKDNPAHFYSTQLLFVKIGLFFNAAANRLTDRDPHQFHLFFQTVLFLICYAMACFLFLRRRWNARPSVDVAIKMLFLFLFLDSGYLVYFNSFYGEAPTLIFLLLSFVLLVYLEKGKSSLLISIALIGSLFLFSGSKPANFPSALLLTIPFIYHVLWKEKGWRRLFLCASIAAMLLGASGYVKHTPDWMNKVTTFHAVFFGVLYDHPAPEKAVKELGLPPELSRLEAVNAYAHEPLNPYNLYDSTFQSLFFDRTGKLDDLLYYLKHPALFAEKLDTSAEAALPLRPTYLTNMEVPSEQADLLFAFRFNAWESVRKHFSGFASLFIGTVIGLSIVNLILPIRRRTSLFGILLRIALMCAAVGQFIIPMVSNGHADLQKHMFLFNVHLDLLILVIVMDRAGAILRNFRKIGLVVLFACLLTSFPGNPETITLGRLEGKPIEWYVLERRDEQVKLIAKNSLFRASYDEHSNDYTKADIRAELDAKASTWFSQEEQELIQRANYSALGNVSDALQADEGDRPHYWFSPIKYAAQNSDRAYRTAYSAYVTLPSIDDAERLFRLSKGASVLPESYWLSTAYYSSTDKARVVSPDYQVYHRRVDTELGVRPVLWVKDSERRNP